MILSPQIAWRVRNIIRNFADANRTESLEEIDILLKMNGDDSRLSLISALLDEMDLKEIRLNGKRDPQKVSCSHIRFHLPWIEW